MHVAIPTRRYFDRSLKRSIDQVVDVCMVHRLLAFFKSTTSLRDLEPMIHFDRLKRSIVPCLSAFFKPWKSCIY